ncbi:16S rRNA (guanine(527)-N(7))-methyltransferase RsmG [Paraclostridium ghonii]|uniref:16S rRNA (guanine(527)-N(7))-methyltransferase RsmG n=1 Tax=Paraclostridium ghonii TaxID=29358 RepID=UPI00202CDC51|nr:16S rRNA (guanine(527)-N(7))-methyltransferase RsmG [Paeniclostridium ghonii]MCM0167296.1 16S rRNA (guanine(527)-N(7))-methyltransferase RsmG [Paeniclostridium ghonii]
MTNADILKQGIEELGLKCSDETINKFRKYREILVEWNQKMNLTGIEEEKEVYIKHFLDSVAVVKEGYIKDGMSIIDVGTGAGFPGLPLRICLENSKVTLLDSLNKRINFLSEVCKNIDIDDVELIHGRAEDFGKDGNYREQYDIATARAVAGLPILMEFCAPFIKVGGYFVCLKGPNADTELEESKKAMELLGLDFVEKIDVELPEIELKHNIVVFKKINNTPAKYPRKAGKPVKSPIK